MDISPANDRELPVILALIDELLAELGAEGRDSAMIDRDRLRADAARNLASGRFLALLARDQSDTAIGVLTLSRNFALYAGGEYGVIDEMYVRPAHRGQGVGRALLAEAVAIARRERWFRLDVTGPTDESDRRALAFYEKAGFEFTGRKLRLLL